MEKLLVIALPYNAPGKYAGNSLEVSVYDDDIDFSINEGDGVYQCLFSLPLDKALELSEYLKKLVEQNNA